MGESEDCLNALGMVQRSEIVCFTVYERDYTHKSFLCCRGGVWRNKGVGCGDRWEDQDVLLMFYLYTCVYG